MRGPVPPGSRQIASMAIERDADLVFARQRARDVAELCGFGDAARARLSTAVSEVARRSLRHGGAVAVFRYLSHPEPALAVELTYAADRQREPDSDERAVPSSTRPPPMRPPVDWLDVAAMLVDAFDVEALDEYTRITVTMRLPGDRPPLREDDLAAVGSALSRRTPADALVELQRQNRELLDALDRVRRAERIAARAAHERQTLLALIPDVVWTAQPDGACDYFSPRWRELTGLSDRDSEGEGWLGAVPAEDRERVAAAKVEAIAAGEPFDLELRVRTVAGTVRWHLMRAAPLVEQGKIVKWFGTCTDVDDGKQREQEAGRVANYTKRMVSVVGHDLRAPLAVVMAAANMVETTQDTTVARRMAGRMKTSVERAGRMIDDLLDYTRVELGGGLPIERRRIDVVPPLQALLEHTRMAHAERRFTLETTGDTVAEVDEDRVVQAIGNLLENAAAHAAPGEAVATLIVGEPEHVRMIVKNRGAVVPPEMLPCVFEPFRRVGPRSKSRGLGLGLFIVAEIAKRHGGTAAMTSSERDGTAVEISLPRVGSRPLAP
jgi:PAS domain S-box-containing protein